MSAGTITQGEAYGLMLREYPDVLNISELCSLLGVSAKTGYALLRNGEIACRKVGRSYRIPKTHVFSYLRIGDTNS